MFGGKNKIVNILGTLLLGTQLFSFVRGVPVTELELKACSEYDGFNSESCDNAGPATNYCIEDDKIYGLIATSDNACVENTELQLEDDNLNLVKADVSSKKDESKIASADSDLTGNYILVACEDGVCKQTQGYLIYNSKIYAFIGFNVGVEAGALVVNDITANTHCVSGDSSNIGKIFGNKDKICISAGVSLSFAAEDKEYMILKGDGATGTPFEDDENEIPLKRTTQYIVKDQFIDAGVQVYKTTDGSLNTISSEYPGLSTAPKNYYLVDCVEGVCKRTSGYARPNNGQSTTTIIAFNNDGTGVPGETTVFQSTVSNPDNCADGDVGKVLSGKGYVCAGPNVGIQFTITEPNKKFLINEKVASGTPFESSTDVVAVKNNISYIVKDKFNSEVNLFNKEDYSIVDSTGFADANDDLTDEETQENYFLYDCKEGVCKQTSGYILSDNTVVAFVGTDPAGSSDELTKDDGTISDCEEDDVGIVIADKTGVCYGDEVGITFTDDVPELYLMLKDAGVTGTPFKDSDNSIPIKRAPEYIVRDQFYTGVALVVTASGKVIDDLVTTPNTAITGTPGNNIIVECKDGICRQTQGYIINGENFVAFAGTEGGANTEETFVSEVDDANDCGEDSIGKLLKDKTALCIGNGIGIGFEPSTVNDYMIFKESAAAANTPFEDSTQNVVIKRGKNYIIRSNFYSEVNLANKADGTLTTDFVTANTGLAATPSNYFVNQCQDGVCLQTQGYVVNDGKAFAFVGDETGVDASTSTFKSRVTAESNCGSKHVGKLLSDYSGFCINTGKNVAFTDDDKVFVVVEGSAVEGTPFESPDTILILKRTANYIIRDYFHTSVDLVSRVDGSVNSDLSVTIPELASTPSNFMVIDCVESVCRQTSGYLKNNNVVVAFVGTATGTATASKTVFEGTPKVTEAARCADGNAGQLITDAGKSGICYGAGKDIKFKGEDDEDDSRRIMLKGKGVEGTPFADDANSVPIKRSENYLLRDYFYTSVNLVNTSDGSVLTDFQGSIDLDNNYVLVDCVNGVCKQTQGYVVDSEKTIVFIGETIEDVGKDATDTEGGFKQKFFSDSDITDNESCTDEKIGYLTHESGSICIGNSMIVETSEDNKRFLILYSDVIPVTTPFYVENENVPVKQGGRYIIVDKFNSVNLLDVSEETENEIINDFVTADEGKNYNLYDCVDGKCRQSFGYIVINENVIGYDSTNSGVNIDVAYSAGVIEESGCSDDNVGQLFTDNSAICIYHGKALTFKENSTRYYLMDGAAAEGTAFAFKIENNGVVVKSGEGYIIMDPYSDEVNFVKITDQSVIHEFTTEKSPSDYFIVDCVDGGTCRRTTGYVINNKKVFGFSDSGSGSDATATAVTSVSTVSGCTASQVGKFISTKAGFCLAAGEGVLLEEKDQRMIVAGTASSGSVFVDNKYVIPVKNGAYYVVKDMYFNDEYETGMGFGFISVNVNDGTVGSFEDLTDETVGNYIIVECNKEVCIKTNGYIKNEGGSDDYVFGSSNGSVVEEVVESCGSLADTGKKVESHGGVCINISAVNEAGAEVGGVNEAGYAGEGRFDAYILLKNVNTSIFSDNENSVMLIVSESYIIRDRLYSEVFTVNKNTGLVTFPGSDEVAAEDLVLVDCVEGSCKQTQGYIMGVTGLIEFIGENGFSSLGASINTEAEGSLIEVENCSKESNIGKISSDPSEYIGICVGDGVSVNFTDDEEAPITNHLVIGGVESTPFESEIGVVAKRGQIGLMAYIIRDKFYNSGDYCTYPDSAMTAKKTKICKEGVVSSIYNCTGGECEEVPEEKKINNIGNGFYLVTVEGKDVMVKCIKGHCYRMTDDHVHDVYAYTDSGMYVFEDSVEHDQALMDDGVLNGLTGILKKSLKLNHCMKGECKETFGGIIRYNGGNSIVQYMRIPEVPVYPLLSVIPFVECRDGEEVGYNIILVKRNMDICESPGRSKTITGVGLILNPDPESPEYSILLQRNSENVIGVAMTGNYIVDDVGVLCDGHECIINNNEEFDGYYLNYDYHTNSEYPLILCKYDGEKVECSLEKSHGNGYYWNVWLGGTKYVVCDNDGCAERSDDIAIAGKPCNENNYDVVYDSESEPRTFKYCNGDDGVDIANTATLTYYYVEGEFLPGRRFNYPTEFTDTEDGSHNEKRTIIVKTEAYSVTVIDEADLPIGYLKTETGYVKCEFKEEEKKMCSKVTVDKTVCDTVGELFKTGSGGSAKNNLCIDPTEGRVVSLDLTTDEDDDSAIDSAGQYAIAIGEGLFGIKTGGDGTAYYAVVEVDGLGNVTVVKEPETIKYRYTDTDSTHHYTNYEIYSKSVAKEEKEAGEICDATGGPGKPFEFEYVPWSLDSGANPSVDYYKEGSNSDLTA